MEVFKILGKIAIKMMRLRKAQMRQVKLLRRRKVS